MKNSLCRRFEDKMQSPYSKVAASLHPMFHLNWVPEHEQGEIVTLVYKAPFQNDQISTNECSAAEESVSNSFCWRFEKRAKVNSNACSSSSLQSISLDQCKTQNDLPN